MNKPEVNIFDYTDYQQYFADWFEAAKKINKRLSHRSFVRWAGYTSSSVISNVMSGKRHLSAASAERFGRVMKLSRAELAYLQLLLKYARAESVSERDKYYAQINGNKGFQRAHRLEARQHIYMSKWYCPAIHELSHRADFRADPAWLAQTLCPSIKESQAAEALETLKELGLLVPDESGRLRPGDAAHMTPPEDSGVSGRMYHQQMLELASAAVTRFAAEERRLYACTVSMPLSCFEEIDRLLREAVTRSMGMCEQTRGADAGPQQVFQLGVQLFPLSAAEGCVTR